MKEISINTEQTNSVRRSCDRWDDFESALAEIIKNSNDQYERLDANKKIISNEREIILFFRNKSKEFNSPHIGVLDFGGMTHEDIYDEKRGLLVWDKEEDSQGEMDLRQLGNGGKILATRFFEESFWHTVINQKCNRVKFAKYKNKPKVPLPYNKSVQPEIENMHVVSASKELEKILKEFFGLKFSDLPTNVQEIINQRKSFTFFVGIQPKDVSNKSKFIIKNKIKADAIKNELSNHQQCSPAFERSRVTIFHNKTHHSEKLFIPKLPPLSGYESPRIIKIPEWLKDPRNDDIINTGSNENSSLVLEVTSENLPMIQKYKSRHVIVGKTTKNIPTGFFPMKRFSNSKLAWGIYGEIRLDTLKDISIISNNRTTYNDKPLIRSLEEFIGEQVTIIINELDEKSREKINKKHMEELSKYKDEILKKMLKVINNPGSGTGEGGSSGTGDPDDIIKEEPVKIELRFIHSYCAKGAYFKPDIIYYNDKGKKIKNVKHTELQWHYSEPKIVNDYLITNMIKGLKPGKCKVKVSAQNGKINSNFCEIEVVDVVKFEFPEIIEVKERSFTNINLKATFNDGRVTSGIYLIWETDDRKVAYVASSGRVHGYKEGRTQAIAADDDTTSEPISLKVIENKIEPTGKGDKSGGLQILILKQDHRPNGEPGGFEEMPWEGDAGVSGDPPVFQDDTFYDTHGIWWINSESPLAVKLFKKDKETGFINKKSGIQTKEAQLYVIERIADILSREHVKVNILDNALTPDEYETEKNNCMRLILEDIAKNYNSYLKS